jgi:hypothetical protein
MPRYVKLKPVTWVKMDKPLQGVHMRPQYGDCVGIYAVVEATDEIMLHDAMSNTWKGYFCFAIERAEFETLLAFDIPLLDPNTTP